MKHTHTLTLLALTCVAVLAVGPQAFAGQLLTNPGFEDNGGSFDGWFTLGGGEDLSTPAGDDIYRSGSTAAKIYGKFTGCPIPVFDVSGFGQAFTSVVVGDQYEFHGYSYISSADVIPGDDTCNGNRAIAKIVFFDAVTGGSEISSNEVIIGDWSTPQDEWMLFEVQALAPPGALRVEALILFLQPACDPGAVFVDDLFFSGGPAPVEPNVLANPSFSSGLTDWSTFGNVFTEGRAFGVRTPPGSAAIFGTFSAGDDSGLFQRLDTAPGEEWRLSAYALNTCVEDPIYGTNQNKAYAIIEFRDSAGNSLGGNTVIIADSLSALGTWTRASVTATAPAGADSVDALIIFTQGPLLEGGKVFVDDVAFTRQVASGVGDTPNAVGAELFQNVPNPFNPTTQIAFTLDQQDDVSIGVYDVKGRLVSTLVNERLGAGPHSVTWDGSAFDGTRVSSGVYFYVLRTSTGEISRRMVLLK